MSRFIFAVFILMMYFLAGFNKITTFSETVGGFRKIFIFKQLPIIFYQFIIFTVILLEILAPVIILYSLYTNMYQKFAYYSSIALALFTVLATILYHYPPIGSNYYAFMKNLTAVGSLLLLSTLFS